MISRTFLSAILGFSIFGLSALADVTGKVKLEGTSPAEKPIAFDPDCKKLHGESIATTCHWVTDGKGGLGNVLVYVKEGLAEKKFPAPTTAVVLDQKQCLYLPYVIGVQVGQTLTIQNSDPFMHNVHTLGKENLKPIGGRDNVGQPSQGMKNDAKFDKVEVFVKIKCDVHPWMFAHVGVLDNPYFAVTGPDGSFKLTGLPDGEYTLAAAHPKAGEQTAKVKVTGGTATAEFKFAPKS